MLTLRRVVLLQEAPVTGKAADAVLAAYYAHEAALRLIKTGNKVGAAFFQRTNLRLHVRLGLVVVSSHFRRRTRC